MEFPSKILTLINDFKLKEIHDFHVSGDKVFNVDNKYILKVSYDIDRLKEEYEKDNYFSCFLPSPRPVVFIIENNIAYYLREYIDGDVLCEEKYLNNPQLLIKLLKEALTIFHSKNVEDCPFVVGKGNTLIHGDFCLPNILAKDNKIVGFIDIGGAGIGDIWCDYAWCIWSLEYNLKTDKYTNALLKELQIEFDYEKFKKFTKE